MLFFCTCFKNFLSFLVVAWVNKELDCIVLYFMIIIVVLLLYLEGEKLYLYLPHR